MKLTFLNLSLFYFFICLAPDSQAQTYSAKVYTGLQHWRTQEEIMQWDTALYTASEKIQNTSLAIPTLAFSINSSRGSFHEIQVSGFEMAYYDSYTRSELNSPAVARYKSRGAGLSLAYEFNYLLCISKNEKWSFFAGTNLYGSFSRYKTKFPHSGDFTTSTTDLYATLGIVPRVQYKFSDKWFADLNFNYLLVSTHNSRYRLENPAFTKEEQLSETAGSEAIPTFYRLRLGIGYNF